MLSVSYMDPSHYNQNQSAALIAGPFDSISCKKDVGTHPKAKSTKMHFSPTILMVA
jgi:hypothetical protein